MVRKLAGLVAMTTMGWVCSVHALGLGQIEIKSNLNEPLVATIPVSSATAAELEGLVVQLASNEEFDRAGLDRAEFLSSLTFEVKDRVIHIRSKESAREPFIGLLLDVQWGSGRLLREYSVLLDPPNLAQAQPQPKPMPKPVPVQVEEVEPSEPDAAETPPQGEAVQPAAPQPTAEQPAVAMAGEPGTYGPVRAKETLWSIAYRHRPDPETMTMDQMQVAIFRANPKAFEDGRITGLMKGVMLQIPDAAAVRAVDAQEARAIMAAARTGAAAPPSKAVPGPSTPAAKPQPAPAPPVAAETAPEEEPEAVAAVEPEPAQPEPVEETEPEPEPMTTAEEDLVAEEAPSEPAPEAAMVDEPPVDVAPDDPAVADAEPEPGVETIPQPPPVAEIETDQPGLIEEVLEPIGGSSVLLMIVAGLIAVVGLVFGVRAVSNRMAQRAYAGGGRAAVPTAAFDAGEESLPDEEMEAAEAPPLRAAPAYGSAARQIPEEEEESAAAETRALPGAEATQSVMADTFAQTQARTQAQPPQAQTQAVGATGEAKVDFDVTGNFATDTVQINLDAGDPLSEAEFHRAYGLYDEAALLLKQALQKDPSRNDARVKLAEIYFEASKADEFLEVAKELKGKVPADEWQQVALMGTQIAPDNELFKGAADAGISGAVDLSFEEPAAVPARATPLAAAPAAEPEANADEGMLDFKMEDLQLPEAGAPEPAAPAGAKDEGLEFDLGELSLDQPPAAEAPEAGEAQKPEEFDLDGLDLTPEAVPEEPAMEMPPVAEPEPEPEAKAEMDAGGELPGDISLDEDAAMVAGDEASTKLDLARAYMDMGDNDMAKSLLNEVLQQGTGEQKKEAQDLLQRVPA